MACLKAWLKGAAFLIWLLAGAGVLVGIFPWLRRLNSAWCLAIRLGWFRGLARILGLTLKVWGTPIPGPVLMVSNHISWLDVVVLGTQAPVTFVAKREVASWPLLGFLARRSGTLFVTRDSVRATAGLVRAIASRLDAGEQVVVFPEGTTTAGETVLPFSRAVFQAVSGTAVPIQPVALRYLGKAMQQAPFIGDDAFLPHLMRVLSLDSVAVTVLWFRPIPADERREVLAERARAAILAGLDVPVDGKHARLNRVA